MAIECCTDIASYILASHGFKRPVDRKDVFWVLAESGHLDPQYSETMVQMVQLRNRLVHLYWDIDAELMHHYLHHDVGYLERFRAYTVGLLEQGQSGSRP